MNLTPFRDVLAMVDPLVGQVLTPERAQSLVRGMMDMLVGVPIQMGELETWRVGSYTLAPERVADCLGELRDLHAAHWAETEEYRHGLELNPDYEWALHAEACGEYLLLTARSEQGTLVGNYALAFSRSRHTQTIVAQEDTMFIAPAHRRGRLFIRFAQYGEYAANLLGARELRLTAKLKNNVSSMLPRMGYAHVANQFVKFLPKEH